MQQRHKNFPDRPDIEREYSIRSVSRVCLLLNLLQESVNGITLHEVVRTTGLPKASALRYLRTLENHRYVERSKDGDLYRLGLGFIGLQSRNLEVLRERARPFLHHIRDELGETVNLGLLDGDHVIHVDVAQSRRSIRVAPSRGDRVPLHCTALGKAIASRLPRDRVAELLRQAGLVKRTGRTIGTVDGYFEELNRVRRAGYAIDDRETEEDGRCVAVPLPGTHPPAALSVSGPSSRFFLADARQAALVLQEAASRITTQSPGHRTEQDSAAPGHESAV